MFNTYFGSENQDTADDAAAVAEDDAAGKDEKQRDVDPMDALDELQPAVAEKPTRMPKQKQTARALVRAIEMPKYPSCSGRDQGEVRTVYVYVKPSCRVLYIRIDCLDWLLAYAADEHNFHGIVRQTEESDPTTAVADYVLTLDFHEK